MDITLVEDVSSIVPILRDRLPISSNIYNMVLAHDKFKTETSFYLLTANDMNEDDWWIMATYRREDYGLETFISTKSKPEVTNEIKKTFSNSKHFDWLGQYVFVVFEDPIAAMLKEISIEKGSESTSHPAFLYYFPHNGIETKNCEELFTLNSEEGIAFFMSTWKFAVSRIRAYLEKVLERLPSVGVFQEGKVISGILTSGNGFMGMLFTEEIHRHKKLGSLCMRGLIKLLQDGGYQPASMVEQANLPSQQFHEKVGMKFLKNSTFIIHPSFQNPP